MLNVVAIALSAWSCVAVLWRQMKSTRGLVGPLPNSLMQIRGKRGSQVSFIRKVHPSHKRNQREEARLSLKVCCAQPAQVATRSSSRLNASQPFPSKRRTFWIEMWPGRGPVVKNPPVWAGDTGLIPGLRRFHMPGDNCDCALLLEKARSPPQDSGQSKIKILN